MLLFELTQSLHFALAFALFANLALDDALVRAHSLLLLLLSLVLALLGLLKHTQSDVINSKLGLLKHAQSDVINTTLGLLKHTKE